MVEQTTLHNVLTCVIAVVIFIFQSLNYLIARIKNYVKHREKTTTTVVTANTTISSDSSQPNDNNALEDFIRVQELIQKHFDIPLIVAEDEPNVKDLIEGFELSPSTNVCREKHESDQYVNRFIDDSYVARGLGLITATVGRQTDFYLYSKHDNDFENIVIELKGRNGEVGKITILDRNPVRSVALKSIPIDCNYDEDRVKVTYTPCLEGVHTLTLLRYGTPICRSPYYVSVEKSPTNSRSRIRLGTKKYKMVTKFGKGKCTPIETKDSGRTSPTIEFSSSPTFKSPVRPVSEESAIKTDVMSIVTKFESKSMSIKKRPQKRMTSITERNSEYDMTNTSPTICLEPKIETTSTKTNNDDHGVSNLRKINSTVETTNENNSSDEVDNQNKENESSYKSTINIDANQNNKLIVIPNEYIETTCASLARENTSPSQQEPAENTLRNKDLFRAEDQNQTSEMDELLLEEQKNYERSTDMVVDLSKTDCFDVEPCGTPNRTSYFDDEDRKTVVVVENANELESSPNDFTTQQTTTDSRQYDIIQPPFTSIIAKITDSVCETCSKQVFKVLSEFPRDINITHNKNTNEVRSTIETLLTQPIRININIDNVIENVTGATQEHENTRMRTDHSTDLEHVGKTVECHSLKEIHFMGDRSEELQCDINRVNTKHKIERDKNDTEISTTPEENKTDTNAIPLAEKSIETPGIHQEHIILSTDQIVLRKCSKDEDDGVSTMSCNIFNSISVHNSEDKTESCDQNEQTSATERNFDSNESNQIDELIIDADLDHTGKVINASAPDTNCLSVTNNVESPDTTLHVNESRLIKNEAISNENLEFESAIVDNTIYTKEPSDNVPLDEGVCNEPYCEQKTYDVYDADHRNSIPTIFNTVQDENQKLMMEKLIEPILNNYFKKNMIRRVLQYCLKKDESNINETQIFENDNTNQLNELRETKMDNATGKTEINIENKDQKIENSDSVKTGETNYDVKSENLEHEYLSNGKIDNNKLVKLIEQIIKTNMILNKNNAEIIAKTKIHDILHTAMDNYSNGSQKNISNNDDDEGKSSYTQVTIHDASAPNKVHSSGADECMHDEQEKTNNEQIMDSMKTSLVEISSEERIGATNKPKINSNDEMINVSQFEQIETKGKMPLSNDTETIMMKDTMTYASTDTTFNTPCFNLSENTIVEECNCTEKRVLTNIQTSNNEETSTKELDITTETLTSNVASINNKSSQESETINEIEVSNETETDDTEKQNNEGNQELTAPATVENIIITSETSETEIINETKDLNTDENEITINTINEALPAILNNSEIVLDEQQSTSSIITSPNINKTDDAKSFTVERETRIKLPLHNVREIIIVEIPVSKNRGNTPDTLTLNGFSTVRIEIDTSDPQKSNATIVLSINDSNLVLHENISNATISDEIKTVKVKESNPVKSENLLNDNLNKSEILNTKSMTENELTNYFDNVCIEKTLKETDMISTEIQVKKNQPLSEDTMGTIQISKHFISTDTSAMTVKKSIKDEVETLTSTLTASNHQVVTTDKTIDIQKEEIVEHFDTTDYANLPIEEFINDVETLNTIKTEIDIQLISAKDSPEEEIEAVPENLTPIDSPIITDEVAVKEDIKNLPENSAPDKLSLIPVGEPTEKTIENSIASLSLTDSLALPVEESVKEVETLTIDVELQVVPVKDSQEVENEKVSEKLTPIDSSIIPHEEAVKEDVENLLENSVTDKLSPTPVEEPIGKITASSITNMPIIDNLALPIEELVKEVETLIVKSTDIDSQVLPEKYSPEVEKEMVSENLTPIDSPTMPYEGAVKEDIKNLPENSAPDKLPLIPVEEPIVKITKSSTTNVLTTDYLVLPIKDPVKELDILTIKPIDIDSQNLPEHDSAGVENETACKKLTPTDSPTITEEILKEKIKNLPFNQAPGNSSFIPVEEPVEKITKCSPTNLIRTDTLSIQIEEPTKVEMESLFKIPTEIVSQVQQSRESLEVVENNVITSSIILTADEPSTILLKNIPAPCNLTETPVEDIFEKEIESTPSIPNDSQNILPEDKLRVENKNKTEDLPTCDTSKKSIEYPANEEIESTSITLSENDSVVLLKYSVIDEMVTLNTTSTENNTDISVVQKSSVVEFLTKNITTNNIPILPVEEPMEKEREPIITKPDLIDSLPVFTEGSIDVILAEITTQVTELENSIEIKDNNISVPSNTLSSLVIPIEIQVNEYKDISAENPTPIKESIEEYKKKEIESLTLTDTSAIPKNGPVVEEVVSQTTVQSDRNSPDLPTKDSSEVKKEIVSENISSIEIPIMPIKEKIEILPSKSILGDLLILPVEEQTESMTEKHGGLNTSDTPVDLVEEPLKVVKGNLITVPTEIVSRNVLANELLDIDKENEPKHLSTTEKPHIPVEEPAEEKTEDYLVNPFSIGSLPAKSQEPIDEENEYIPAHLITAKEEKILIAESSSKNSLKTPLEDVLEKEKESIIQIITSTDTLATPNEEQEKLEVVTLTPKPTKNDAQTVPAEELVEEETNHIPKHFSCETPVISTKGPEKEEIETPTTEPVSKNSLYLPIEEPETEEIETIITKSALEYSSISPIEEPIEIVKGNKQNNLTIKVIKQVEELVKMEIESSTKIPIDIDSQILIEEDSIYVEKEILPEQLIPADSLTTPDEVVKEKTELLPTKTVPNNTPPVSIDKPMEKREENLPEKCIGINTSPTQIEELGLLEIETISINQTEIFSQSLAADKPMKLEEGNIFEYSNTTDKPVILNDELVKKEVEYTIRDMTDNDSIKVLINESSKVEKKVVSENKTKSDNISIISVEETTKEIIETIPTNTAEVTIEQLKTISFDNLTSTDTLPIQSEESKKMEMDATTLTEMVSQIIPPEQSVRVEHNNITKSLSVTNTTNVLIKDQKNEEIETLQLKPTLDDFLPISVEKTMETIKENISNVLLAEETVKIELETLVATTSETISQVLPAKESVKGEEKYIPKHSNAANESIAPIEELVKEKIEYITKASTESDSEHILPTDDSSELEKKSNLENLATTNAISVEEPMKEEIKTLTTSLSDLQCLPAELSLDDKIQSIPENAADNHTILVEKQENNEVEIIPPKLIKSDSLEVFTEDTSKGEDKTISKTLNKDHTPSVTSEPIKGVEIKTLNTSGDSSNTVENITHNEIPLLVANSTYTVSIEESTELKKPKESKTMITCDTLESPIENPSNDYGDTLTVLLTKIESKVVPLEDTSSIRKETMIPEDLKSNEIPTVPTEKKMKVKKENTAEGLNNITDTPTITIIEESINQQEDISSAILTANNSVVTVSEKEKEVLSENVFLTAPVKQSFETGKDTIPENVISIETLTKTMEVKLHYVHENLNSNEIAAQLAEESLDMDKEIIHGDLISNKPSAAMVEEKLEMKKESISSEHLILSDTKLVEDVIRYKIETLSTASISSNSSPAQSEEPMEIGKDVHSILSTSETTILTIIEEPVKKVQTLKIDIDSQLSPAKDSSEVEKEIICETLPLIDSSTIPGEITMKGEIENIPANQAPDNLSIITVEETTKKTTVNSNTALPTTDSLTFSIEESVKEVETLTIKSIDIDSQVLPTDDSTEVEKEIVSEKLPPIDSSIIPGEITMKEDMENIPGNQAPDNSSPIPVENQMENTTENSTDSLVFPIEESVKEVEILTRKSIDINLQVLPVKDSQKVEKEIVSKKSPPFDSSIMSDEIIVKEDMENIPANQAPDNVSPIPVEEPMENTTENSTASLPTTDYIALPIDESVKEVETLTTKSIDVELQVVPVKDSQEVENEKVSEKLTPIDSLIMPAEITVKKEMENLPVNQTPDNSPLVSVAEPMEKVTGGPLANLVTADTSPIQIEELMKVKMEYTTSPATEFFSRVLLLENQVRVEKDNSAEFSTDIDIPLKESNTEETETATTRPPLDDFVPTPVEELEKFGNENLSENLTKTHKLIALQTVKQMLVEKETFFNTQTEIFTQIVPLEESIEKKENNLLKHLNTADEVIVPIEQSSKENLRTSSTKPALDDSLPTPLEVILEEKKETFSKKCTLTDTSTLIAVREPLNNEVQTLPTRSVTMNLPVKAIEETVSEPIQFQLELTSDCPSVKKKKVLVSDELKGTIQFITNKTLLSDSTKSLSIKHSSDDCVDVESEDENKIVDDFDVESIDDNSKNVLLREENDITFEPSYNITTPNDGENLLNNQSDNNILTSYGTDETVINVEKTNYNYQTASPMDDEFETGNSDYVPNTNLDFGETSTVLHSEAESGLREKSSFGIQKLEMSVHRVQTSDDDYFEKTFVQLEQAEKISTGENITEDENRTTAGDKLYTVNESDLNAILCASSLQEALTLLDSKIKFKFKHGTKTCGKKNSAVHKSNKTQTSSSSSSSGKNANFAEAREYFKTIEKKSKK